MIVRQILHPATGCASYMSGSDALGPGNDVE
jgi:hypothetical protein